MPLRAEHRSHASAADGDGLLTVAAIATFSHEEVFYGSPANCSYLSGSRAGRLRAFFVLIGLGRLCLLAFRSPAFAEEAQPDPSDDAPTPRAAMDVTDKVSVDGVKLQKKSGDSWLDIPAGTTLTSGAYVRIYIDWSIPDMTDVHAGDTFTFTVNGDDHFLASDFGPVNLVDPTTQKVIGSYVVNGNRDANGSMIPVRTSLS